MLYSPGMRLPLSLGMRSAAWFLPVALALAAGVGCRRAVAPSAPAAVPPGGGIRPQVVARVAAADTILRRRGLARLVVAVRLVDAPEVPLSDATVQLYAAHATASVRALRAAMAGADGVAAIDSVSAAEYDVWVRRVGYQALAVRVRLPAGCGVRLEAYLPPAPMCLFSCPQTPPRATVTTCAPAA